MVMIAGLTTQLRLCKEGLVHSRGKLFWGGVGRECGGD